MEYCQNLSLFTAVYPKGLYLGPILFLMHFNKVSSLLRPAKFLCTLMTQSALFLPSQFARNLKDPF